MTFFETKCMLVQPRRVYLLGNKFFQWVWLKKGLNITTWGFKSLTQQGEGLLNLKFESNCSYPVDNKLKCNPRACKEIPHSQPKLFHSGSVCSSITHFVDCLCWRKWEFHCIKKSHFDFTSVKWTHWQSMQCRLRRDKKDIIVSEQFSQQHKTNTVYSKLIFLSPWWP